MVLKFKYTFIFVSLIVASSRLMAAPPGEVATSVAFKAPAGWKVELFASEPKLWNPVAFCLDERGRVYVAEEHRFNRGTEENRTRPFLLEDDLQLQTVNDRLAMYKKFADRFEGGMNWFSKYADVVRRIEDTDGDGKADVSTVFAGPFNGPLDGLAAGVIARDGDVYLTNIPNLWLLRDKNGDGVADEKRALIHGFGVNAGFLGHDLHGLVWGPDGKLYFSVGDRGFHVETPDGAVHHGPRRGAVFRCDPGGANFEVVARGLRNPQELAFDAYGNLFAADNNCDLGDHARLVYVIEGGDSGWNMSYQTIPLPYQTGPWHAERLWHLQHEGQAAYIVPPVAKLGAGPSGFVTYPGLGLGERYRDHFFYCNYTGNGGVESFALKPRGAGFEMVDYHPVVTPVMATDVDFGYDGKMYMSEFGRLEWDGSDSVGRIYKISDPAVKDARIAETQKLFAEGFRNRSIEELVALLNHPDMRARQRAQFALAERGDRVIPVLADVASKSKDTFPRLHAIWGLGQIARQYPAAAETVIPLLKDGDHHVRKAAAKVLGDVQFAGGASQLVGLLKDEAIDVRLQASLSLGKLRYRGAVEPLWEMVKRDDGRDPFLRHASVMGLLGSCDSDEFVQKASDPSAAVRTVAVLALRRLADPRIVSFLNDKDLRVANEAARAINDLPIEADTALLASQIDRRDTGEIAPLLRRAINANFRLGEEDNAEALGKFVTDASRPMELRLEALEALGDWFKPSQRDRVTGFWRPLPERSAKEAREVLGEITPTLLNQPPTELQARAIELGTKLGVESGDSTMVAIFGERKNATPLRLAALRRLAGRDREVAYRTMTQALGDADVEIRSEARKLYAKLDPGKAIHSLEGVLDDAKSPISERQDAFAVIATIDPEHAQRVLANWLSRFSKNQVADGLQLDLIDAIQARGSNETKAGLAKLLDQREKTAPLGKYQVALKGGNVARGQAIFKGNRMAQCTRCHKIGDSGGTAGPELTKVAGRNDVDRNYLLQSMIEPDAKIASGFGTVSVSLGDGRVIAGVLKSEKDGALTLDLPDGRQVVVPLSEIDERSPFRSAMPKMTNVLNMNELRDVVEYLSTLK